MENVLELVERLAVASREAPTPVDLLVRTCADVASAFAFERVVVASFAADTREVRVVAAHGVEGESARRPVSIDERPLLARALAERELVFADDAAAAGLLPAETAAKYAITSVVALPLLAGGRCLGFLGGDRGGAPFRLDDAARRALTTVGVLVATLLEAALVADERRRLDAAKTQFVALASHELRTPVAVMYGITSTLVRRGSELRESQLVELRHTLHEQTSRLRVLVDHLLDLSRIDAHAVEVKPERLRVRSRIEELVLVTAERRAADVALLVDPRLEAEIDPDALDRILSNLLVNALKYGEPPITISAEQQDRHFRLVVEDRGPGIAERFVERLFERFARSEESSAAAPGTGLGLAIARSYAQAHGGDIVYSRAAPHGARFELIVPQPERA